MRRVPIAFAAALGFASGVSAQAKPDSAMSFFISSSNPGHGANLGGLAGADAYCQTLAQAAGGGGRTWRAYLSTQPETGKPAVNARDRIGPGPWFNFKGLRMAADVADLHSADNKLDKENSLTEKGDVVNGRGDTPNRHDILTGSKADGTAFPAGPDQTCANWTSETIGAAMLGHSDRHGAAGNIDSTSWNQAHLSSGCSPANLTSTGGSGYIYCFAADAPTGIGKGPHGGTGESLSGFAWLRHHSGAGSEAAVYSLDLERERYVSAAVFALTGRRLAVLAEGTLAPGSHSLAWDGRDGMGRMLPEGFYLIRVRLR